jgi:hypothetical protein
MTCAPSRASIFLSLIAPTTVPATAAAADTAALCDVLAGLVLLSLGGEAHSSADASGRSSGNGCEEGGRAVLSECQEGNCGNKVLGVGKHGESLDLGDLELLLLLLLVDGEV